MYRTLINLLLILLRCLLFKAAGKEKLLGQFTITRPSEPGCSRISDENNQLAHSLVTTIQYQRYWLVCEGNTYFESCVEGKS